MVFFKSMDCEHLCEKLLRMFKSSIQINVINFSYQLFLKTLNLFDKKIYLCVFLNHLVLKITCVRSCNFYISQSSTYLLNNNWICENCFNLDYYILNNCFKQTLNICFTKLWTCTILLDFFKNIYFFWSSKQIISGLFLTICINNLTINN